jgi:hypothetical protein
VMKRMINAVMAPIAKAIAVPYQAQGELLLALIGHLHDRGLIDRFELVRLLEGRIKVISADNPEVASLVEAEINWLMRLGSGMPEP